MSRPIILIHGAWHGAWCFDLVAAPLLANGHQVYSVDLPLTGFLDDVNAARELIQQHPGAVVLGHSYGGLVITSAATGLDVGHLVYLAALMPDQHEDVAKTMAAYPVPLVDNARVREADGTFSFDPTLAREAFYDDCDQQAARSAIAKLRPHRFESITALEQVAPWRNVPTTYVVCARDKAMHPQLQKHYAAKATHNVEWDVAHSPFLAKPEWVVALLADVAAG